MEKLLEAALDVPFSLASKIFSGFDITVLKNHAERRVCLKGRREEAKEATKKKRKKEETNEHKIRNSK